MPVRVSEESPRPSRLFQSNASYILRSLESIARIVVLYNPLRIFLRIGALPVIVGLALLGRFLFYYVTGQGPAGHVQSLILAVILITVGVQVWVVGVVADLIAVNRRLLEEAVEKDPAYRSLVASDATLRRLAGDARSRHGQPPTGHRQQPGQPAESDLQAQARPVRGCGGRPKRWPNRSRCRR